MDDKSDAALVDTHPETFGGDENVEAAVFELALVLFN